MFAQDYYYDVFLNMELFQLPYYNQWKLLRGVSQTFIKHNHIRFTGALTTSEMNLFYGWLRKQNKADIVGKDIISLRDMFENDTN